MGTVTTSIQGMKSNYFNGTHYNNWQAGIGAVNTWWSVGSHSANVGGSATAGVKVNNFLYVQSLPIPTLIGQDESAGVTLKMSFDVVLSASQSGSTRSYGWGIFSSHPVGQAVNTSWLSKAIYTGTWSISGLTNQHKQCVLEKSELPLVGGVTYFLLIWGDAPATMYQHGSYYSATVTWQQGVRTKCAAPTSFTVSKSQAQTEDDITFSWSGASSGAYNTIQGYRVRYTDDGSTPGAGSPLLRDFITSSTSGSFTMKIPNAVAGKTYKFAIYTLSTYEDYHSDRGTVYPTVYMVPATACTTPTTVTVPGSVLPGTSTSVAVSWSGAKAGTWNAITGYRIYYTHTSGSTETKGSKDVTTSATSGSTILSFNTKDGDVVSVAVQTKCTNATYWSPVSTTKQTSVKAAITACSAPTTFTGSTLVSYQADEVTVSWSGAKAGTNNAITGYRLYYTTTGADPTTSSGYVTVTTSATSGSYTFLEARYPKIQGRTLKVKVLTIGSKSSYNSPLSTTTRTIKRNTLPTGLRFESNANTPTLSASGGKGVTFTMDATSTNNSNVYVEIWGKNNAGADYVVYPRALLSSATSVTRTINPPNAAQGTTPEYTFTARFSDNISGAGYFNRKTIQIKRAGIPIVHGLTVTPTTIGQYQDPTSPRSFKSFCAAVSANLTSESDGYIFSHDWKIRTASTIDGLTSGSVSTLGSGNTLSNTNVAQQVPLGHYYQIGVSAFGPGGSSGTIWQTASYPASGSTEYPFDSPKCYRLAPKVEILALGNKSKTWVKGSNEVVNNWAGTEANSVYKNYNIGYSYNSLYTATVFRNASYTETGATPSTITPGSYGKNASFTNNNTGSTRIPTLFWIKTVYGAQTGVTSRVTRYIVPTIESLASKLNLRFTPYGNTIKPLYKNKDSVYEPTIAALTDTPESFKNTYEVGVEDWVFTLSRSANGAVRDVGTYNAVGLWHSRSGDTLSLSTTGKEFCGSMSDIGGQFNKEYSTSLSLKVVNLFGASAIANSVSPNFNISFKEEPYFGAGSLAVKRTMDGSTETVNGDTSYGLHEDNILTFVFPQAASVDPNKTRYQIQVTYADNLAELGQTWENYVSKEYDPVGNTTSPQLELQYTVRPILNAKYVRFRVIASNSAGSSTIKLWPYWTQTGRTTYPSANTASITGVSFLSENTLTLKYQVNDMGGGYVGGSTYDNLILNKGRADILIEVSSTPNFTKFIEHSCVATSSIALLSNYVGKAVAKEITLTDTDILNSDFIYLRLKVRFRPSTGANSGSSRTTYLGQVSIPNVAPTVAYRAGGVGINARDLAPEDTFIVKRAGTVQKYIRFINDDSGFSDGHTEIIFNLETGEVEGLSIDCGTWI